MGDYCCDDMRDAEENGYSLGSHYHCANCGLESGGYGHYVQGHWRDGKFQRTEGHFCCDKAACPLSGRGKR